MIKLNNKKYLRTENNGIIRWTKENGGLVDLPTSRILEEMYEK